MKGRTENKVRKTEADGTAEILGIVQALVRDYHIARTADLLRALRQAAKGKGSLPVRDALAALSLLPE